MLNWVILIFALGTILHDGDFETFNNGEISFDYPQEFITINNSTSSDGTKFYTKLTYESTVITINEATPSKRSLTDYYQDIKNIGSFSGSNPNTGYTQKHTPIFFQKCTIDNITGYLTFHKVLTSENGSKNDTYFEFVLLFVKDKKVYVIYGNGYDQEFLENTLNKIIETFKTY